MCHTYNTRVLLYVCTINRTQVTQVSTVRVYFNFYSLIKVPGTRAGTLR